MTLIARTKQECSFKQKSFIQRADKYPAKFFFLVLVAYIALLLRDMGGGVFRYYTDVLGASKGWYVPDLLIFVAIALTLFQHMRRDAARSLLVVFACLLFALIGFLTTQSTLSVISALKMIAPLLVGGYAAVYRDRLFRMRWFHFSIFCLAVTGVILSQFIVFPWINYVSTNDFGIAKTAANSRTIDGIARLSGFASDSTAAAYAIMISAMILMRNMRFISATALAGVAFYAIILTTSRTAGVALFVYYVAFILQRTNSSKMLGRFFLFISVLFVLTPFIVPLFGGMMGVNDVHGWAYSMIDRIQNTWVNPYVYVWDHLPFGFITGLGLGAVAFPVYYSPVLAGVFTCADNFMLANYLMFGLFGLCATIYFLSRARKRLADVDLAMLLALVTYGIAIQGYGVSTYALMIGLLIGGEMSRSDDKAISHSTHAPNPQKLRLNKGS